MCVEWLFCLLVWVGSSVMGSPCWLFYVYLVSYLVHAHVYGMCLYGVHALNCGTCTTEARKGLQETSSVGYCLVILREHLLLNWTFAVLVILGWPVHVYDLSACFCPDAEITGTSRPYSLCLKNNYCSHWGVSPGHLVYCKCPLNIAFFPLYVCKIRAIHDWYAAIFPQFSSFKTLLTEWKYTTYNNF